MLKVVGASWHKTRIGSYILIGALMLAVAAFFLAEMERPSYNGTYCATTYWARNSGYRLEFWGQRNDLDQVPKGAVRACFRDSILTNGWSQLELESQSSYTDTVQAYAAGIMEGALTWHNIYMHWSNTIDAVCSKDEESEEFCDWLRGLITTNVDTVKKMADMKGKHDYYWYQIALFYDQLDGLEIGFRKGVKRSRMDYEIPKQDFLLMNAAVDIRDLKIYYTNFLMENSGLKPEPAKGMMLLKLTKQPNGLSKILLGHTSDGSYSSMLRMVKKYTLRYHFGSDVARQPVTKTGDVADEDRTVVPGTNIVFTGYPGVLASLDDFYVINGRREHRLVAAGVKMENEHVNLWRKIDLVRSVSLAPRVMAANRLGHSGRSWARYFARNPSTGVKQWLVIDMTRFVVSNSSEEELPSTPPSAEVVDPAEEDNEIPTTLEQDLADSEHRQQRIVTKRMEDYVDDDFKELQSGAPRQVRMVTIPKQDEPTISAESAANTFGPGMFWVIDQLPGRLHAEDITEKIVSDGYWLTNGVPYFKEALDIGQANANGTATSTASTNSTATMEKILQNITDLETLSKFFRQSAYRGDLDQDEPAAFGNIDLKLYTEASDGTVHFRAYSGPLYDPVRNTGSTTGQAAKRSIVKSEQLQQSSADPKSIPTDSGTSVGSHPFDWGRELPFEVRHQGHPDVWDFEHITPEWAWI